MLADLCGYSKVRSVTHDIQIDTVLFFNTIFNNLSKPAMNRFFVFPKRTAAFAGSTYCISLWAMRSTTTGAMKFTIPSRGRPSSQKLGTGGIVAWWHWKGCEVENISTNLPAITKALIGKGIDSFFVGPRCRKHLLKFCRSRPLPLGNLCSTSNIFGGVQQFIFRDGETLTWICSNASSTGSSSAHNHNHLPHHQQSPHVLIVWN